MNAELQQSRNYLAEILLNCKGDEKLDNAKILETEIASLSEKYIEYLEKSIQDAIFELNILESLYGNQHPPIKPLTKPVMEEGKKEILKNKISDSNNGTKILKTTKPNNTPIREKEIHIGRLNLVVGKIVSIQKHPNADSLYIETVDVGGPKNLTICSGLVNKVPLSYLDGNLFIFCVNLKPVKGITSEGMILCASEDNSYEPLSPPAGAKLGDRIICPTFNCEPDKMLNPKEKILESVLPEFRVDDSFTVVYRGVPMCACEFGHLTTIKLKNCKIS